MSCAHGGDDGFGDYLIQTNKDVSEGIDALAERLDLYVANRRYVGGPNKSRITLFNAFSFLEGGTRRYSPHIGAKLHLPNLQEKLQLNFTTYDGDVVDRGINENRYQTMPTEEAYSTSLSLFQELGVVRTEFRPMLEYTDRLQTSYLFRFSSDAQRGGFTLEPEAQIFARSDTGTGEFFAINVAWSFGDNDKVRLVNEEQYTDADNTLTTNHGPRWYHQYNELMSQQTGIIFESSNRSTYHLDKTVFSSSFRHEWRKNVLHYSITPFLSFTKGAFFHPVAALDFKIEIVF